MRLGDLFRKLWSGAATECAHLEHAQAVTPSSPNGCTQCRQLGDTWVHLRICLICGQVGCCDSSKNKHATKHFHATGHALIQSFQPGEGWRYCYVDKVMLPAAQPFRRSLEVG